MNIFANPKQPPRADAQTLAVTQDTPLAVQLTGSAPQNHAFTYAIASNPSHGSLTGFNANTGAVTYNPAAAYVGADSFTFTVTDKKTGLRSAAATVSATVSAAGGTPFLQENFVGSAADISGRVASPTGGTWTACTGNGSNTLRLDGSGHLISNNVTNGAAAYYNTATPPSADYDITYTYTNNGVNNTWYLGARNSSPSVLGYQLGYENIPSALYVDDSGTVPLPVNGWVLYINLSDGSYSVIGFYPQTLAAGASQTVTLRIRGKTLSVYLAGVMSGQAVIEVTDDEGYWSTAGTVYIQCASRNGTVNDNAQNITNLVCTGIDAPLVPGAITFSSTTGTTTTATIGAASGGSGSFTYQFQRAADTNGIPKPAGLSGGGWSNVGSAGSSLSFGDTGLTAGTYYWYRVLVTDGSQSVYSHPYRVLTTGGSPAITKEVINLAKDVTYLGYYSVPKNLGSLDQQFGQSLSYWYGQGSFRLLTLGYQSQGNAALPNYILCELVPPASPDGSSVTIGQTWSDIWQTVDGDGTSYGHTGYTHQGLWYNAAQSKLWSTCGIDYPNTSPGPDPDYQRNQDLFLFTRTLNTNGTISSVHGPVGISGITSRRFMGGAMALPSWFQSAFSTPAYAVGFGGYASLVNGSVTPVSLGLSMSAIPDPAGTANNGYLTGVVSIADCSSATGSSDWYGGGAPSTFDRGVCKVGYQNWYDGLPGAQHWTYPAPDYTHAYYGNLTGLGRWPWGCGYHNTGIYIDGTNKHGFLAVATILGGNAWYHPSTLNRQGDMYELHSFSPYDLGAAVQGTIPVWDVKPRSIRQLVFPGYGYQHSGSDEIDSAAGACFDPATGTLYVLVTYKSNNILHNRINVYSVDT